MIYNKFLSLYSSYGGCQPNKGSCGPGREIIKLGCYKIENRTITTQVDLSHCDQREIERAKSTYRSCDVPCQSYVWKPIMSQARSFFNNFFLILINRLYSISFF